MKFPFGRKKKTEDIDYAQLGQGLPQNHVIQVSPAGTAVMTNNAGKVDLVFVIDTTGSMSNKINGLLKTCNKFVDQFARIGLDHRVAIMAFGDLKVPEDKIVTTKFTADINVTKKSLKNIPRFSGGGNEGESSLEAMHKAIDMKYREDAVKVLILITDEPAHQDQMRAADVTKMLTANDFLVFTVAPNIGYYKTMAKNNGGKWYKVGRRTDFTDMLKMFQHIANKVTQTVRDVYTLGDGSVANYRRLSAPDK